MNVQLTGLMSLQSWVDWGHEALNLRAFPLLSSVLAFAETILQPYKDAD